MQVCSVFVGPITILFCDCMQGCGTCNIIILLTAAQGVGTSPAGLATAGPKFPEPTIKNIIPLFVIKQIRNFCITVKCLYHFNKGIILLYYQKNKTVASGPSVQLMNLIIVLVCMYDIAT